MLSAKIHVVYITESWGSQIRGCILTASLISDQQLVPGRMRVVDVARDHQLESTCQIMEGATCRFHS
jgi:hypothetical protein